MDTEELATMRNGLRLIAFRSLSDPDAADDAVQETLLRGMAAWRDGRIQSRDKISSYFRGILRHVIADLWQQRARTVSLEVVGEPSSENGSQDALSALVSREQIARVRAALAALPARSRQCLELGLFEGLTPTQIADRLQEPPARVRKRRSRALGMLREAFHHPAGDGDGRSHADQPPRGHHSGPHPTYTQGDDPGPQGRDDQDVTSRRGSDA